MKNITLLSFVLLGMASSLAVADDAVVAKYNQSCAVCHNSGVAGAPKTGVADDWTSRLDKGMDTLVASVTNGMNAMPPKGMCNDCSADDYKALISYMSKAQ